ncbi:carbamoyltransferase HypF [bacterium]|nr:carbamoyltransferase HypF [bacterium]
MPPVRRRLLIDGIVQGVGFRPFVFKLAESEHLTGFVTNTSAGVIAEIQGPGDAVERFTRRLRTETPPLARIVSVKAEDAEVIPGEDSFAIAASVDSPGTGTLIPPDVGVCADCLREIRDPRDRRHRYPFTNCTNCGPRWTIIGRIPYDRPYTSMAGFVMCDRCRAEYGDPRDRRFHAQPNACPACGPRLSLEDPSGPAGGDPLESAADLLAGGAILAVKGLGGFHLAVRADDPGAVARLRRRKQREGKPLAVMAPDLEAVRALAVTGPDEEGLLRSPAAPIVLLEARSGASVCREVAGGHRRLGVMLPYTPLHHLLLDAAAARGVPALVMTSGNAGNEPICLGKEEARARLAGIADAWLLHDRDILRRADDSVVQILPGDRQPLVFRRSRGYAPVPVLLAGLGSWPDVLAAGPELKSTVCLLKEDRAFLSPHVGDLENLPTHAFFRDTCADLQDLLECRPRVLAHDLHPGYLSTQWARDAAAADSGLTLVGVQHHHAHLAAVLAEHGRPGPAVGLILDGTGFGTDGTIWGGEILLGDCRNFRRLAHLETVPLPGGDTAVRQPWRTAVGYLRAAFGPDRTAWPDLPFLRKHPVDAVMEALDRGLNCPVTSSCGRLFDAVAALTGRWPEAAYEAQAAIEWMALTTAKEVHAAVPYPSALDDPVVPPGDPFVIPVRPLVRSCAGDLAAGVPAAVVSARFHRTLIDLLAAATAAACADAGLTEVVLAGGALQNEILLDGLLEALGRRGLACLRPVQVPPNDGAVALGQAVVARARFCGR